MHFQASVNLHSCLQLYLAGPYIFQKLGKRNVMIAVLNLTEPRSVILLARVQLLFRYRSTSLHRFIHALYYFVNNLAFLFKSRKPVLEGMDRFLFLPTPVALIFICLIGLTPPSFTDLFNQFCITPKKGRFFFFPSLAA